MPKAKKKNDSWSVVKQLNNVKSNIDRIYELVTENGASMSVDELDCRLEIVESYVQQALQFQTTIENTDEITESANTSRADLEDMYCKVKVRICSLIKTKKACREKENKEHVATINKLPENLPKLKLPIFSGIYSEFPNFIHLFRELVHQDARLSAIEKFNHLLSSLRGAALNAIKSLDVTAQNYDIALKLLEERFSNKYLICQEHVKELFKLNKVQKNSADDLRWLIDNVSARYNALQSLLSHEEMAEFLITHLVTNALDADSHSKLEETIDYTSTFQLQKCLEILKQRCRVLEARDVKPPYSQSQFRQQSGKAASKQAKGVSLSVFKHLCGCCKQNTEHELPKCAKFKEMTPEQRYDHCKRMKLCITCFSSEHTARACKADRCQYCNYNHHSLLHRVSNSAQQNNQCTQRLPTPQNAVPNYQQSSQPHSSTSQLADNNARAALITKQSNMNVENLTILATALVDIVDHAGNKYTARAILDSAAQLNFMTQSLANCLSLKKKKIETVIGGIGEHKTRAKHATTADIASRYTNFVTSLNFVILPKITGIKPARNVQINGWNIPQHVKLADPKFYVPQHVDLLLGADVFFELMLGNQLQLDIHSPRLFETKLGWVVSGKCDSVINSSSVFTVTAVEETDHLETIVEKFWELESVPQSKVKLSKEQSQCEEHFIKYTKRLPSGRFVVKLPLKQPASSLGDSKEVALRRFYSLEKRMQKDDMLKSMYADFLQQYEDEGHMELACWPKQNSEHYFLPHHCVLRMDKSTTKCRVVFDASAKSSNNLSLNDILMVGPVVQSELFDMLLQFRLHRYGLMADIAAMYRQIEVYPEDQLLQHIIWRSNSNEELKVYRLKTVTYGTASAPYLATRCLSQLADENQTVKPAAANIIKRNFYVDDLITGGCSLEEILNIKDEVTAITAQGQFQLRKWYSNHKDFVETIPPDEREKPIKINNTNIVKALGVVWDFEADSIKFNYTSNPIDANTLTKRKVLSELAKLFDPLGLVKPVITKAKVFMQELWLKKLTWDDIIPDPQASSWIRFVDQLQMLNHINVPRFILQSNSTIELHGFADASTRAYGCCFYIRCTDDDGNVITNLYTSKSKVTPISTVRSMPCLELCAVHLMAQLLQRVKTVHSFKQIVLWCDNMTVLCWLAEHASNFNVFVANRVSYIQEHAKDVKWRYVPSASNPADILSRGLSVKELEESMWFQGPTFLKKSAEHWPAFPKACAFDELPERKLVKTILVAQPLTTLPEEIGATTNDFIKICKRMAYIRRFAKNARSSAYRAAATEKQISASELDESFIHLCFIVQQNHYAQEFKLLQAGKQVTINGSLKDLNPFIEEVYGLNIIKVGGRLKNADLPYDAKCPIILPKGVNFVSSYVKHLHVSNLHASPQVLVGLIRARFWIIGVREYARKIVKNCILCFKYRPRLASQLMGDLPKDRVNPAKPFMHCGVDFCGPVWTTWRVRGKPKYKSYIAVFICFATRAVHMEVVSDLSADAFLAALKRFIGRRGLCRNLYLDNATNFVGARNKLREFKEVFFRENVQVELQDWCAMHQINFKHIPPRSPHFGGLWEAAVKSAKTILYKTLQAAVLTFEELSTVIAQIEGILNSKPLTPFSNDPSDEQVLTPAHFLNTATEGCLVEPSQPLSKISQLKVWHQITALQQHFWARWSREYISQLQQRRKWATERLNIKIGDMVLIQEENMPPQKWAMRRVVNTVAGNDGKIRVADIRTASGICRRAITKLAVLPLEE